MPTLLTISGSNELLTIPEEPSKQNHISRVVHLTDSLADPSGARFIEENHKLSCIKLFELQEEGKALFHSNSSCPAKLEPLLDSEMVKQKYASLNNLVRVPALHLNGAHGAVGSKSHRRIILKNELARLGKIKRQIEIREKQLRDGESWLSCGLSQNLEPLDLGVKENSASLKRGADDFGLAVDSRTDRFMSRQTSLQLSENTLIGGVSGKEKRTPKANSAYINQDFVSGKDKLPPPEKLRSKSMTAKRGLQFKSGELKSLKRQKIEAARARRMADIMKMCGTLLKKLLTHKWAWVFDKPVDAVALNIPDYHTVIKEPMDLGTIDKRFKANEFKNIVDFARDVRLVFANAMTYNPPHSDVHLMALELSRVFESHFMKIETKMAEEFRRMEEEELASDFTEKDIEVGELYERLQRLEAQVEMKDKRGKPNGKLGSNQGGGMLPKPKKDDTEKRPMTFEEKRKLSVNLGRLPGDKLGKIVQIISSHQPNLTQEDDEIELDIDSLDNETLWELHRYVSNVLKSKSKQRKKDVPDTLDVVSGLPREPAPQSSYLGAKGMEENIEVDDHPGKSASNTIVPKEKDGNKSSSSGSSGSSESGSSSSDSESGSGSSGSESENEDVQSKEPTAHVSPAKEPGGSGAGQAAKNSSIAKALEPSRDIVTLKPTPTLEQNASSGIKVQSNQDVQLQREDDKPLADKRQNSEVELPSLSVDTLFPSALVPAPGPLSTEASMRAALLREKYADSIINAQKKISVMKNMDAKQIQELEEKHKLLRAQWAKEAEVVKAAQQAEIKRKRQEEREAARIALSQLEQSVLENENVDFFKAIPSLQSIPLQVAAMTFMEHFNGRDVMESCGLILKDDDDVSVDSIYGEEEHNEMMPDDGSDPNQELVHTGREEVGLITHSNGGLQDEPSSAGKKRKRDDIDDVEEGEIGSEDE